MNEMLRSWKPKFQIYGAAKIKEALIAMGVDDADFSVFVEALHAPKPVKPSRAVLNPMEGPEKVTKKTRREVFERDGHRCQHCGSTKNPCLDHIYPKRLGGKSASWNLQVLCRSCNSSKGSKI